MKRAWIFLLVVLLLPETSMLAQSRLDKPNDFTIELLGRCILYCFSYQRMVGPQVGVEVGFSLIGGAGGGESSSVFFLSGGPRFYFTKNNASPCIAGGLVFVSAGTDAGPFEGGGSTVYLYAAPGFEFRSASGFLFRGSVNFLIKDGFFVWPGLTLGVTF
jgi:hypothetical protein